MKHWNQGRVFASGLKLGILALTLWLGLIGAFAAAPTGKFEPLLLVVMDPLSREMSCACVKGYGQRDYRRLAAKMESALKQKVSIEFSDDLPETLAFASPGQEVVVIGEQSRVTHGAKKTGLKCQAVCELTDPDGGTTVTASFVVSARDAAKELKDIGERTVLFGLADTDENHAAAQAALRAAGVTSGKTEKRAAYTDAALDVLDGTTAPHPVALIPGYGVRLLEGCGSITPGDLRVIGRTEPMPFIAAFVADNIPAAKKEKIVQILLGIKADAKLLQAMESRDGFKRLPPAKASKPQARAEPDWSDWRGPGRAGQVPRLPARLPETAQFIWKKAAMTGGLAGLSVSGERLILSERDFGEEHDVYRCLHADTGELLWRIEFSARGQMDYGQSPRATPVIHEGKAYLLGAFGELRCINVADGKVIWKRHLLREFHAELPTWGFCSPPLVVDDLLIVNPGGTNASLAALDRATGRTRWTTPGNPAGYSAFICGEFGGRRQIVGYDQYSLGGWDVKTGARLWQLVPPTEGDFNVPTPIAINGGLVVATENNGTRFYQFDAEGRIIPQAVSTFADLAPDTATPVVTQGRVFGAHYGLRCLDLQQGLKQVWHREDDTLGDYASLFADAERVLVVTLNGELILLDGKSDECAIISRLRIFPDEVEVYSHPALVGNRLYVRGGSSIVCLDLGTL